MATVNELHRGTSKIVENLFHLSEFGVYIIGLTDLPAPMMEAWVNAIRAVMKLLKEETPGQAYQVNTKYEVASAFAVLENKLPMWFCTMNNHMLYAHNMDKTGEHGSFKHTNILREETMHVTLRKLVKNVNRNILDSLRKNYYTYDFLQLEGAEKSTLDKQPLPAPTRK